MIGNLTIVAPDEPSGKAFHNEIDQRVGDIVSIEQIFPRITARVVENKLNLDPQVTQDLAAVFEELIEEGKTEVAIACNTLQLWVPKALQLLEDRGVDTTSLHIHTTFDAVTQHI